MSKRVGAVVALGTVTASVTRIPFLNAQKFGLLDNTDVLRRYLDLDGSYDVRLTDSSGAEGGYFRGTSVKANSIAPVHIQTLSLGEFLNGNAYLTKRTRL